MNLHIEYLRVNEKDCCPCINISDNKSFEYSNIYGMYKNESTQGHGIQVSDLKLEKSLLKMCDKISQAIYDYHKEQNGLV